LGRQFGAVEEVARWLKELLFPSIADVAVLSVDVNIEIVRVDAQCIANGALCPVCGVWSNRSGAPGGSTGGTKPVSRGRS
jgi:hypothetical protein